MAKMITAETLDSATEFDYVFTLSPDVEHNENLVFASDVRATYRDSSDYAPGVHIHVDVDDYGNFYTDGLPFIDKSVAGERWSFFSQGYTGQYGARQDDPSMHPSECVRGRLAQDMIEVGGTFAVVEISPLFTCDDDCTCSVSPIGWVVLRKDDD